MIGKGRRIQRRFRTIAAGMCALAGIAAVSGCVGMEPFATQTESSRPRATLAVATASSEALPTPAPASPTLMLPTEAPTEVPTLPIETPLATPAVSPEASGFAFDPLSEEALVASMMDPTEVDPAGEGSGVDIGTEADDLPSFAEQGGLRRTAQTIQIGTDYTVYDFRYQFPDATSAEAFLNAEADALGETESGAVEIEAPIAFGDDTRYYVSHIEIIIVQDSFNYLIRVENVVAKVWIGGDPQFIDAQKAMNIASEAWGRMALVFDPSSVEGL